MVLSGHYPTLFCFYLAPISETLITGSALSFAGKEISTGGIAATKVNIYSAGALLSNPGVALSRVGQVFPVFPVSA